MHRVLVILAKYVILVACSAISIWWAYSMSLQVKDGVLPFLEARRLVVELSVLTAALSAAVWIANPLVHRQGTWIKLAVTITLETALILILYTAAVFVWRDHWNPADGMSEPAQFMPIVGHVNAQFFSDFLWLEYLCVVVPIVSLVSGALSLSFTSLQSPQHIKG
jgi:hypothetical protein